MASQIYFTADLHIGHSPNRQYSYMVDIKAQDEWLLDLWRSTISSLLEERQRRPAVCEPSF